MEQLIKHITKEQQASYSINFLLAELHEVDNFEEEEELIIEDPESPQYNTHQLDTFSFYKPISSTLSHQNIQALKEVNL